MRNITEAYFSTISLIIIWSKYLGNTFTGREFATLIYRELFKAESFQIIWNVSSQVSFHLG